MKDEKRELDALDFNFPGKGVSRRDFLKYCGLVAATLGLEASFIPRIAEAITGPRPPVVWLQFAECTGCTEGFLRSTDPFVDDFILGTASLEYHETLMAPSGQAATANLNNAVSKYAGQFICICEGAIPTADNGIYGMIGGKTMLQIAKDVCPKALAVISLGTCASFGGLPAAAGNLTGAMGVHAALGGYPTINIPGCPPNPVNLVATIVNYLLQGTFPDLDADGRPLFAYGATNHSACYRRESPQCLRGLGCRGPETYLNCPVVKFNYASSFPIAVDAPCYGCSTPGFWDKGSFFNYNGSYGWI